jgi:hypothetical protein
MDRDTITRSGARTPGVERRSRSNGGAPTHCVTGLRTGYYVTGSEVREGRMQTARRDVLVVDRKARLTYRPGSRTGENPPYGSVSRKS